MKSTTQTDSYAYWVLAALCAFSAALLFFFRAAELSGMSTGFAGSAGRGEWDFFAHHLFFQPMVRVFAELFGPLGCTSICAGQVHSIMWAVIVIGCSFLIVLHLTKAIPAALFTGVLMLFSHNIWIFATQVEPYMPLIGLNALIATIIIRTHPSSWTMATTAAVTLLFTFSLFFHQANIFFLVPIAIYLGLSQGRSGLLSVLTITAVAGAVSLGVYILVYLLTHPEATARGFRLWLTYYGVISDNTHGTWQALLTLDADRLKQTGRSVVATIVTEPSDSLRTPIRIAVTALLVLVALWNIVYIKRNRDGGFARLFLLTWALTFLIFFAWWHSNVHKFFLTSVIPLLILSALSLSDLVNALRDRPLAQNLLAGTAVVVLGTIAAINFSQSVRPLMGYGSGIGEVSNRLANAAPSGCVLYTKRRFGGYLSHGLAGHTQFRTYQTMYQSFHFSRFNPDIKDAMRVSTDVTEDDCNVILLDWLSYDDFQWKRGRSMRRAQEATAAEMEGPNWPEFIAWMFNVRPAPDGAGIVHDEFLVFLADDDEAFVRINRRASVQTESLDALLDKIDHAILNDPRNSFTRRAHSFLNKFRNRVFGYS